MCAALGVVFAVAGHESVTEVQLQARSLHLFGDNLTTYSMT